MEPRPSSSPRVLRRVLRKAILVYGVLAIAGAVALAVAGFLTGLVFYLFINGVIVVAALLFERGRYRPLVSAGGRWQETAERFVDPSTGILMKVRYNPQTGARDYVPVDPSSPTLPREGGG
jgi:hypothetical protein